MSTTPSTPSTALHDTLQSRPSLTTAGSSDETSQKLDSQNRFFISPLEPRAPVSRQCTSLQEHANAVAIVTSSRGGSSPHPESRREGFAWDVPGGNEAHGGDIAPDQAPEKLPTPLLGQKTEISPRDASKRESATSVTSSHTFRSSASLSTGSSFNDTLSRNDTGRSSIGSIARGVMRHVPDMTIFLSNEEKLKKAKRREESDRTPPLKPHEKSSRNSCEQTPSPHALRPSALKSNSSNDKCQKHVNIAEGPAGKPPSPKGGGGVKDRRKLDQADAMKLTLPLELPSLPARQRDAVHQPKNIAAPRRHSPTTPWNPPTEPITTPTDLNEPILSPLSPMLERLPQKVRDRCYIKKSRVKHNTGTGTSDSSLVITPDGNVSPTLRASASDKHDIQTKAELKELGKINPSHHDRWGWSGPWNSTDIAVSPASSSPRPTPFSRLLRSKHAKSGTPSAPSLREKTKKEKICAWRRKLSIPVRPHSGSKSIAAMPDPPTFIPPGSQRVPTPPMHDANGEVKGRLADFFFDPQGLPHPKVSPVVGGAGVWDSDALLMPQEVNFSQSSTSSEEPPPGLNSLIATPLDLEPPSAYMTATSPATHVRFHSSPEAGPQQWNDWLTVNTGEEDTEDMAKFEWYTPEHLPGSPLCPLDPKYKGPSPGICVFHGRRPSVETSRKNIKRESIKGKLKEKWGVTEDMDGAVAGVGGLWCGGLSCSKRSLRSMLMSSSAS